MTFFLKRKFYRRRTKGEILPPWYYGLVYIDHIHGEDIFCPMPLNYILKAAREIKFFWDKFRSKPTWIDKEVEKYIAEINKGRIN